jgi:hypothetical protein
VTLSYVHLAKAPLAVPTSGSEALPAIRLN